MEELINKYLLNEDIENNDTDIHKYDFTIHCKNKEELVKLYSDLHVSRSNHKQEIPYKKFKLILGDAVEWEIQNKTGKL